MPYVHPTRLRMTINAFPLNRLSIQPFRHSLETPHTGDTKRQGATGTALMGALSLSRYL